MSQTGAIAIRVSTDLTKVRCIFDRMQPRVFHKFVLTHESFGANRALIAFVAPVPSLVDVLVVSLSESLVAKAALVRSLVTVRPLVTVPGVVSSEGFRTL